MVTALDAANTDPMAWQQADQFRPERFLDADGKLCLANDNSVPFAAGKRLCAGETFARNMLFLLISGLFQQFGIDFALNSGRVPSIADNATGFVKLPNDFWIKLIAR